MVPIFLPIARLFPGAPPGLPLAVICAMLGLPERDHNRFRNRLGGLRDVADFGSSDYRLVGSLGSTASSDAA